MKRTVTLAMACAGAAAIALTGCGTQTDASEGVTAQLCDAMTQVDQATESLSTSSSETVGQAQQQLQQVTSSLETASSEASGLAGALLTSLNATVSSITDGLQNLSPDAQVPSDFANSVNGLKSKVSETTEKLKCSQ